MSNLNFVCQIFVFLGIDFTESKGRSNSQKIIRFLPKIIYPLILHLSILIIVFILNQTFINFTSLYAVILDVLMVALPCALWWSVYRHRNSIKNITQKLLNFKKCEPSRDCSKLIISISIIYWFCLLVVMAVTAALREEETCTSNSDTVHEKTDANMMAEAIDSCNSTTKLTYHGRIFAKEIIQFIQQMLFPFFFAVLCITLCSNFIKSLKHCQQALAQLYESNGEQPLHLDLQEYLSVIKCAENFAEVFSTPIFIFFFQMLLQFCLLCLDLVIMASIPVFLVAHFFLVAISLMVLTVLLSFYAAEIPLKIEAIKRILNDMLADQQFQGVSNNKQMIEALVNRETVKITACNIVSVDRASFLKIMVSAVVYSVIYYHAFET